MAKKLVSILLTVIMLVPIGLLNVTATAPLAEECEKIEIGYADVNSGRNISVYGLGATPYDLTDYDVSFSLQWLDASHHSFRLYVKHIGQFPIAMDSLTTVDVKLHYHNNYGWNETGWVDLAPLAWGETKTTIFPIPTTYSSAYVEARLATATSAVQTFRIDVPM